MIITTRRPARRGSTRFKTVYSYDGFECRKIEAAKPEAKFFVAFGRQLGDSLEIVRAAENVGLGFWARQIPKLTKKTHHSCFAGAKWAEETQ